MRHLVGLLVILTAGVLVAQLPTPLPRASPSPVPSREPSPSRSPAPPPSPSPSPVAVTGNLRVLMRFSVPPGVFIIKNGALFTPDGNPAMFEICTRDAPCRQFPVELDTSGAVAPPPLPGSLISVKGFRG